MKPKRTSVIAKTRLTAVVAGAILQCVSASAQSVEHGSRADRHEESTPSEFQRVFAEIEHDRPDAIMVHGRADLTAYHQLIVELANKSRLPAMYPWRDYAEAGGLMAYGGDLGEVGRRMADEVHEILNGAKPGDIPIYQPTKYELVINLKTAKSLDLTFPPALLAAADEVIE